MPAYTPTYGLPYPVGTDRVQDGDDAMRALAEAVENLLVSHGLPHRAQAGSSALGTVAGNAGVQLAITFAVGRFTSAPVVTTASVGAGYGATGHGGTTSSGCTLRYWNPTGTSHAATVHWWAVQMFVGSGPGLAEAEAEPYGTEAYVVECHVDGCENAGHAIELMWDAELDGEFRAACGVCGTMIEDVRRAV